MFCCSDTEQALTKRFEDVYARSNEPVMQAIERQVCGCDFGGNSWTSRIQADAQIGMLGLKKGSELIDLGAGMGWPGIYMAGQSGCKVTLVDLPEIGLKIARQRAEEEGLADLVSTRIADAANLPYPAASFDAVSHSDLLCCLISKLSVLRECRRIVRPGGVMVFTVISVSPGLSPSNHTRALNNAPEFVEADQDYPTLLKAAGWEVSEKVDQTGDYEDSCVRQVEADKSYAHELGELLGPREAAERLANWHFKLSAVRDGLCVRDLFVCRPIELAA
jgi:SAM-dependent methyltransferase